MRIMHLSDLHIGKRVHGISMLDEQSYVFDKILDMCEKETPACVIIAGDIYDRSTASNEAVALFDSFLTDLSSKTETIVAISGNHDSPERVAYGSRLLRSSNIFMSPVYSGVIDPVVLSDKYGKVNIYPIPFVKPATVRAALGCETDGYADAFAKAVGALEVDPSERNVAVAHQFVEGAVTCESEEHVVGGVESVSSASFDLFDYAALGHLHRAQRAGREEVRYCGTPLKYSMSEVSDNKSVTMVELDRKGEVKVYTLPIEPKHDMIKLRGTFDELVHMKSECFVHAVLTDDIDVPDAPSKLRSAFPNLMTVSYDNKRTQQIGSVAIPMARTLPPDELMRKLYEMQNGLPLNPLQEEALGELIERIFAGGRDD